MTTTKEQNLIERLRSEAEIHAQEARTANATIAEIYQICTGGTGEPGNWNGAKPVRERVARLTAERDAYKAALEQIKDAYRGVPECRRAFDIACQVLEGGSKDA